MNILHIHQDYPDGRPYPYTKAVSNLIHHAELQDASVKHKVISINRTSNPFKVSAKKFEQGISVVYWAIPLPYLYYWSMRLASWYIGKQINNVEIDLIHAHKLTCEGVLAYFLANKTNKPYVVSIRGGSDMNNVNRLAVHNPFFSRVYQKAKQAFWVSAWAKKSLQKILTIPPEKIDSSYLLPNICNINLSFPHQSTDSRDGYVTAVSYHQHKRKGLAALIEAISALNKKDASITLSIYGSGDDVYKKEIEKLITTFAAEHCIFLKGQVKQQELLNIMSVSKGFLLPAVNETFGMSYIEAISVGCPILYVANTGIDGYFDDVFVGEKISAITIERLQGSIERIHNNNTELCSSLKQYQNAGLLTFCNSKTVANDYLRRLKTSTE